MKSDHPQLPITDEEVAQCALDCHRAGASMIHLHARDQRGEHTLDPETCQRFVNKTRDRVGDDMLVQLSTEAVGIYSPRQQFDLIQHSDAEAVSLALSEILPDLTQQSLARDCFGLMAEKRMLCQLILYSPQQLQTYQSLFSQGLFTGLSHHLLLVIGKQQSPFVLKDFNLVITSQRRWAVCAFGDREYEVCCDALKLGGDVRVGFENNLNIKSGKPAKDNADLVGQVTEFAEQLNLKKLTATKIRQFLEPENN